MIVGEVYYIYIYYIFTHTHRAPSTWMSSHMCIISYMHRMYILQTSSETALVVPLWWQLVFITVQTGLWTRTELPFFDPLHSHGDGDQGQPRQDLKVETASPLAI